MIRIAKSANAPAVLTTKGVEATRKNCELYTANSSDYDSGKLKFEIDGSIYGHTTVKEQLIAEQYGKCCFCESDFTANGYGDVEHFRPKAGYTTTLSGKLNRPGYYWLAYDWDNLFFSCQICNQQFKKNFFPLIDESRRAKNHTFEHESEQPNIIHPSIDYPEEHIQFNRHVPAYKTVKGQKSIQCFGINRPKLNALREKYLQNVSNNIVLAGVELDYLSEAQKQQLSTILNQPWGVLEKLILTAKEFVQKAATDSEPFALMVRQNFPALSH